jgi:hypothetical protein
MGFASLRVDICCRVGAEIRPVFYAGYSPKTALFLVVGDSGCVNFEPVRFDSIPEGCEQEISHVRLTREDGSVLGVGALDHPQTMPENYAPNFAFGTLKYKRADA